MKRWEYRKVVLVCAWSTYEEQFIYQLKNLGVVYEKAIKELLCYPPQTSVDPYFHIICKNNTVDKNFIQSFNSWILKARKKTYNQDAERDQR